METLELKTITIPYDDFKKMQKKVSLYESFMLDLEYLISEAQLDYYKKDLEIKDEVNRFAKKYQAVFYAVKLRNLKAEEENKEEK